VAIGLSPVGVAFGVVGVGTTHLRLASTIPPSRHATSTPATTAKDKFKRSPLVWQVWHGRLGSLAGSRDRSVTEAAGPP